MAKQQQTVPRTPVFNVLGSINTYTYPKSEGKAFFTIAPVVKNQIVKNYLTGAMPVTGLHIQEGVDFSITKSLSQDFLVAAFGDSPVTIMLRGISFDEVPECLPSNQTTGADGKTTTAQQDRAMEFYDRYKLSADIENRVDIGISTTNISYRCALIAMEVQKAGDGTGNQNLYSYTIKLIGVRKTGGLKK